jgi:hypothetical protein
VLFFAYCPRPAAATGTSYPPAAAERYQQRPGTATAVAGKLLLHKPFPNPFKTPGRTVLSCFASCFFVALRTQAAAAERYQQRPCTTTAVAGKLLLHKPFPNPFKTPGRTVLSCFASCFFVALRTQAAAAERYQQRPCTTTAVAGKLLLHKPFPNPFKTPGRTVLSCFASCFFVALAMRAISWYYIGNTLVMFTQHKELKMHKRGGYNQIIMSSLPIKTQKTVKKLVSEAAEAQKVDEHGNWEFGAAFDSKGRGESLNWDLYAVGKDFHNKRMLAVIQVRKYAKYTRRGYANVKKSYFLLGRNEDNTTFAHPVSSSVIHRAIKDKKNVILRVQSWIFGHDYTKVVRHGDVALVPLKRRPNADNLGLTEFMIQPEDGSASHQLEADMIAENGKLYALNPHLSHLPGTHPDVSGEGWFKVMVGQRADFYEFAAPTAD